MPVSFCVTDGFFTLRLSTTLREGIPMAVPNGPLLKGASMNLQISGHHLEVTPALREYVTGKLDRVTRHFDYVIDVNAILSVDKLEQKAEVTMRLPGKDVFVESSGSDLYAAIDDLIDKLDRQVQKYKQKLQNHHRGEKPVHDAAK
jgi:putative sigma-54 modulation protein